MTGLVHASAGEELYLVALPDCILDSEEYYTPRFRYP
jgi:hypothetical protein